MKKKKLILMFSLIVLSSILFSSCKDDILETIGIDEIELSQSELLLSIDEVQPIIVNPTPDNTTENIVWESSNEQVALIQFNEKGLVAGVKGISLGETILTAKNANGKISKSINVGVITKVKNIKLEEEPSSNPSVTKYNVVISPENATIKDVVWSSSEPSVASVIDGVVTALSPGITTISATTVQGGKTATVEINVSGDPPILGFQYCEISGTGGYNADTVTTTGAEQNINYAGPQPANNYEFSTEKLIVVLESEFNISLTQSNNWSKSKVWIDWNGDKDFDDEGELVVNFGVDNDSNNGPFNAVISVPSSAISGTTRMRIQTLDAWVDYGLCGLVENQSTKDFEVEITGKTYCRITGETSQYGDYWVKAINTSGAVQDLNFSDPEIPSIIYKKYSDDSLIVIPGSTVDFTIEAVNQYDVAEDKAWVRTFVYIDWGADFDFTTDGDLVAILGDENAENNLINSFSVVVPQGASIGEVRMRVLTGDCWGATPDDIVPCDLDGPLYGIQDFNVVIQN